ncbi:MAG: glycoside hydrolase family 18 protein [Spirosomataceae bacterium]
MLTHINFSFAIPAKTGDTLEPLKKPEALRNLVRYVHQHKKQVFISIGGWGIGDGGGDDTRFHRMAERAEGRHTFVQNVIKFVRNYHVDGVDLDWEYPDEDSPSADHYVALVSELADSLHAQGKKLTAAVISYGKKGYGTKKKPSIKWTGSISWPTTMTTAPTTSKPILPILWHKKLGLLDKRTGFGTSKGYFRTAILR